MAPDGQGDPTARVLVADDDPAVRRLFAAALTRARLDVVEAADGQEALERLQEGGIDAAVLDARMPRRDGLGVLGALRERPETRTLPVILVTGRGRTQDRVRGLEAGANDYLTRPVHAAELVARVRAQLRGRDAWRRVVESHVRDRARVVEALSRLRQGPTPEATAAMICRELQSGRALPNVALIAFPGEGRTAVPLASAGALFEQLAVGQPLSAPGAAALVRRAAGGPWIERHEDAVEGALSLTAFGDATALAGAPLRSQDRVLGCLVATARDAAEPTMEQLLSATIDYAAVSTALLAPHLAVADEEDAQRAELRRVMATRAFFPVFQPIVDLETGDVVGHEALTRFSDGTSPARRFADAATAGLGVELEEETLAVAISTCPQLPAGTWMSANASPALLVGSERLIDLADRCDRPLIYELTEHDRIDDYPAIRKAVDRLGAGVRLSVDDAGSGYACLRHVLALDPAFVKLDRGWISGIEADPARQALVAGLGHFTAATGAALIAEGIERDEEIASLRELGVPLGQGFLLGQPAPVSDASAR